MLVNTFQTIHQNLKCIGLMNFDTALKSHVKISTNHFRSTKNIHDSMICPHNIAQKVKDLIYLNYRRGGGILNLHC